MPMNYRYFFWGVLLSACVVAIGQAQVTNLSFNNTGTTFTMTSGDTLRWEYDITPGATAQIEYWLDVNQNGTIEDGTDALFASFTQTDGNMNGNGGPPDLDGAVNGHVVFYQQLGLAPGYYVGKFTHNASSVYATGIVSALSSPAHTVSGHVTPPPGKSAKYIFVELHRDENFQPNFWDAFTDSAGLYTVELNSDTAGNPWHVRIANNPFSPSIVSPPDTFVTITGTHTGYDFTFSDAAAQVTGIVKDENGTPIGGGSVSLSRMGTTFLQFESNADAGGLFRIGIPSSALDGSTWFLQSNSDNGNQGTTTILGARANLPVILANDSLYRELIVYSVNSEIRGRITIDNHAPGFPLWIAAINADSGQATAWSDSATGTFTIPVSDKISAYELIVWNLPNGWNLTSVQAQPGDTGISLNAFTTSVIEREPGIPAAFSLSQNYPNPFNPSTRIDYDIPVGSYVRLTVVNILGQEVERLVERELQPGRYEAQFDARGLPSGVYFYRLVAGSYSHVEKMILMR